MGNSARKSEVPPSKVIMWNEGNEVLYVYRTRYKRLILYLNEGNEVLYVYRTRYNRLIMYLNNGDGEIGLNLGLGAAGGGGGAQVQGGGKQPFQFSLGDKHQGNNPIALKLLIFLVSVADFSVASVSKNPKNAHFK